MENMVTKRIKEFLNGIGLTVNGLSKIINIGQPTLSKQLKDGGCGASLTTIVLLLQAYPDLSAEWLLRGEGSMKREEGLVIMAQNDDLVEALKENIALLKENNAMLREKVRRLEAGEKDPVASCAGYGFIAAEGSVKELVP